MECDIILEEARREEERGNTTEAIRLYKRAVECFDSSGENEKVAQTLYLLGELYRRGEDYYNAAIALKDSILRYLVSGNTEKAEEISKNVTDERIRSSQTFQFALELLEKRAEAQVGEEVEELTLEEVLTEEQMGTILEDMEKKIEITPADAALYEIIGGKPEGFIPSVERIQLAAKPTESQSKKLLARALEKKRVRVESEVICTVTAKREGEDAEESFKTEVGREDSEHVAEVSFENVYESPMKDVVLTCYVPACYVVERIDSEAKPQRNPALEGMEAVFRFKELKPGGRINVNFKLGRNVSRTLVIQQGKEIWVVRTHTPITRETPTLFRSSLTIRNTTGEKIDNIVLEDVIPLEYAIVSVSPEKLQPQAKEPEDTLVLWKLSGFEKDGRLEITYQLERRKTTRIIEKQLQLKDGRNIGRLTKIVEPLEQGKFLVNIEFQNTTHADLENVKISDRIPATLKLIKATIEPEVTTNGEVNHLSWRFGSVAEGQSVEFSYIVEGEEARFREPPEIELEGYRSYDVRHVSTDTYQGIIQESQELREFKKQATQSV